MSTTKPSAIIDRDGFPPCTMTVDEFCAHIRETFEHPNYRIVAFRVRAYAGFTLTTTRGVMSARRVTAAQAAACKDSVYAASAKRATP